MLLCIAIVSHSQTIDSVNIKCLYKLTYVMDTNYTANVAYDTKVLEIGEHTAKYYSYNRFKGDSIYKVDIEKGVSIAEILANKNKYNYDKSSLISYQNYPKNMISVTENIGQLYLYTEDLKPQSWQIEKDTQTIYGISCQKATTLFRGRSYTAWFTFTIPTPFGPWKFNGLPGLILKISDSQNQFIFECIAIENGNKKPIIPYQTADCLKTTRKEMRLLNAQKSDDPVGSFMLNNSSMGVVVDFGDANIDIPKRPYNPIEKTYD